MSSAAIMLRELSEPWSAGEKVKSAIDRAARLARLTYWRASDIWYGKARKIEDYEIEQIQEALKIKTEKAARNELRDLKARLIRLESLLAQGDADFYRPSIDHAGDMVRELGRTHRPVAGK